MSGDARLGRLCAQVQRVISQWLAFESPDELMQSLFVEAVEPAPDARCLRVTVSVPPGMDVAKADVLAGLLAAKPDLKRELARVLNRRKNPDFNFLVIRAG
jgi:ribosome-binding factor A